MGYLRSKSSRFIIIAMVLLLTVAGMYLRAQWRIAHELTGDEKFQICKLKSFSSAVHHGRHNVQFPGDYVLIYPFYQFFGENKWGLAIPHIIITLIGFYLLYILCQRYFKTVWGYLVAFVLFAYNYNLIYHAFEIRPYSVNVTLSIAGFLVMQYIFRNENPSLVKRSLIFIFIFFTIVFSIFGGYILFFSYLYHLLFSREKRSAGHILLKHLKYYGLGIILALPICHWYIFSGSNYGTGFTPVAISNTFAFIPKGIIPILKGVFGNLTGPKKFYPLLAGIIISFLIPQRERLKQMAFFAILIIVPIALLLLACIHFQYWFIQRLFIWAIPLFAFFLGWCWDSIIIYLTRKFKQYKGKLSQA